MKKVNKKVLILSLLLFLITISVSVFAFPGCVDTDGGKNLYIKGSCTDSCDGPYYDQCAGGAVSEYYCSGDVCSSTVIECPNGECCSNGACNGIAGTCTDTDGGKDEFTQGTCKDSCGIPSTDGCTDTNRVLEYYCSANKHCSAMSISCPSGYVCENGKCVYKPTACSDTDQAGGCMDIHTKGTCTDATGDYTDTCSFNNILVLEYYCYGWQNYCIGNTCYLSYIECPNGECCSNGACNGIAGTCKDTDGGKDEFTQGICYDSCDRIFTDGCTSDKKAVVEYYCNANKHCDYITISCPPGTCCGNGKCSTVNCPTTTTTTTPPPPTTTTPPPPTTTTPPPPTTTTPPPPTTTTTTLPPVSITVTSSPTGSGFISVDGNPIPTPTTFSWSPGSTHTLSANSPVSCGAGCRYIFISWSDGGSRIHTITTPSSPTTYTASYQKQYYLTMSANPSAGGTVSPGSGWRNSGASVTISATANAGYVFSSWTCSGSGCYSGNSSSATITMSDRISETANFIFVGTCNNNGICESTETQASCPHDCYTVASFTPSANLLPGQEVTVTVYFNDSRWSSTKDASLNLTIDGKEWTECQVQNKKWADMGWPKGDGVWTSSYSGKYISITSYTGYARLDTNCSLPSWLTSGTHYFVAQPTMYSEPTVLMPATATFSVGPTISDLLVEFIKQLLLIKI